MIPDQELWPVGTLKKGRRSFYCTRTEVNFLLSSRVKAIKALKGGLSAKPDNKRQT